MTRISNILCHALLSAVLLSCSHDGLRDNGEGWLCARVYEDDALDVRIPQLRSGNDGTPVFSLTVYDAKDVRKAYLEDCSVLADNPLALPAGRYTAVVSSAETGAAAFGAPFYTGSTGFSIVSGEVANIDITAAVANTKVTVEYDDAVKDNFSSYDFTVSNGQGELVFSNSDGTADEDGWFSVTGTLSWTLSLVNNDGQKYRDLTGTLEDVKAKEHYKFRWSLETEPDGIGAGAVSIVLDDSMNEKEFTLELDPDDTSVPVISADFDYSGLVQTEAGDASSRTITVSSEDGFSSLLFTYSDPADFSSRSVELAGASEEVLSALSSAGISVSAVQESSAEATIDISSYISSLPVGRFSLGLTAIDRGNSFAEQAFDFEIISNLDAEIISAAPWAMFADVSGRWFAIEKPQGLSFQYRKSSDSVWIDYAGEISADDQSRTYGARLTGLEPGTEYSVRAVSAEDKETKEITFTTEKADSVPNMSFDAWYQDGDAWYPNADADNFWWDSANGGTKTLSIYPTTPAEEEYIYAKGEGKNAAKLQSKEAMLVGLAAGNIYTGRFIKAVMSLSNPGAELDWGVPFTSRPLALTGYYHYIPVTVNKGDYNGMSGKTDIGQVQVMLTDWSSPFRVSTADGQFVNPQTDKGIIAYGTMDLNATGSYQPFTIELEYRDTSRVPKYIVIVAAASKYGDYFTGGVGSTLYLDEFSFIYDPEALSR